MWIPSGGTVVQVVPQVIKLGVGIKKARELLQPPQCSLFFFTGRLRLFRTSRFRAMMECRWCKLFYSLAQPSRRIIPVILISNLSAFHPTYSRNNQLDNQRIRLLDQTMVVTPLNRPYT